MFSGLTNNLAQVTSWMGTGKHDEEVPTPPNAAADPTTTQSLAPAVEPSEKNETPVETGTDENGQKQR